MARVLWWRIRWRGLAIPKVCHWILWIGSRVHHGILCGHSRILGGHWITHVWIVGGSNRFSISIIHGLHWIAGHRDLLDFIWCPASLLPSLIEVAAGTHEAAHHGSDDCYEQEDGRGDASDGGRAELEEHAALLLPLCDHLEGVQAAIASVAVPAAECDEGAVEAVVPGAVLIHIPQAILVGTGLRTGEDDDERRRRRRREGDEGHHPRGEDPVTAKCVGENIAA